MGGERKQVVSHKKVFHFFARGQKFREGDSRSGSSTGTASGSVRIYRSSNIDVRKCVVCICVYVCRCLCVYVCVCPRVDVFVLMFVIACVCV